MMLTGVHSEKTAKLRRIAYLACMPFFFAYIFFDVLDLDGSNLPSLTSRMERSAIVAELGTDENVESLPERVQPATSGAVRSGRWHDDARFRFIKLLTLSPLEKARTHRYRVSLPRDAVPD